MKGILQALQVIGSILSTKMTGDPARQIRFVLVALLLLTAIGYSMQAAGAPS
ncbi:hypothetical protein [Oligoflexus tunisiensis]|uniref:hypothetical protein n=1 Tax=Oligoflexus tunisiensis TaxID=708132 RepID=UPI00159EF6F8|nr:hypothetical protein [Oligoflexus tunisiensis]